MEKGFGPRWQLQRIPFVPARNSDAHSIDPSELGLVCLNQSSQVKIGLHRACYSEGRGGQARAIKKLLLGRNCKPRDSHDV